MAYDSDAVAAKVQKAQEKATPDLDVSDASCPDDSEPEEGASIECTVTIEGVDAPYTVTFTTVTDDDVKFDIAPAQAIISTDKVVEYLVQEATDQQGIEAPEADCGGSRSSSRTPTRPSRARSTWATRPRTSPCG